MRGFFLPLDKQPDGVYIGAMEGPTMESWEAMIGAIIGLLVVALLTGAAAAWEEDDDRCPRCGQRFSFFDVFCRRCGRER